MALVPKTSNPFVEAIDIYAAANRAGERLVAASRMEQLASPDSLLLAGEMCLEIAQRPTASLDEKSELLLRAQKDWREAARKTWSGGGLPVTGRALIHLASFPQYEWHTFNNSLMPRPMASAVNASLLEVGEHYLGVLGILGGKEVINNTAKPEVRHVGGDISELELILLCQRRAIKPRTKSRLRGKDIGLSFFSQDRLLPSGARYDVAITDEAEPGTLAVVGKIQSKSGKAHSAYDSGDVTLVSTRYDLRLASERRSDKLHKVKPLPVGTILRELVREHDRPEHSVPLDGRTNILSQKLRATSEAV